MRKLMLAAAVSAAALAAGGSAFAQKEPAAIFKAWDKNADGVIDKDEWAAAGRKPQGFERADANHDGKITLEEFTAALERMRAHRQQMMQNQQSMRPEPPSPK